ncbi:hypothetical protein CAEBREN_18216 [Caenorhabditis brenneri]|uniref:Uncharacterized protein n=1 Tax=Caenorhabditis brenneri TaxID=135651 RepID=G0N1X1_CAEBE|nr:hypothetical protein CAEBREN_18216 [Caenorhabditis brenneri]
MGKKNHKANKNKIVKPNENIFKEPTSLTLPKENRAASLKQVEHHHNDAQSSKQFQKEEEKPEGVYMPLQDDSSYVMNGLQFGIIHYFDTIDDRQPGSAFTNPGTSAMLKHSINSLLTGTNGQPEKKDELKEKQEQIRAERDRKWNEELDRVIEMYRSTNLVTDEEQSESDQPETVQARYIYQLYSRSEFTPSLLNFELIVAANKKDTNIVQDFQADPRNSVILREFLKVVGSTPDDQPILLFNGRFVLVKKLVPIDEIPLQQFVRANKRNPFKEPPILEEIIDQSTSIPLEMRTKHRSAGCWPDNWPYEMVEYASDIFWWNQRPVPKGYLIPPKPVQEEPPPQDFNWTPPPGPCPIDIPKEAYELFEEQKAEHFRKEREKQQAQK